MPSVELSERLQSLTRYFCPKIAVFKYVDKAYNDITCHVK